ncbi:MAG: 3-deoxy-7-phosphoheptulonate synthase, partial [Marinobacter maritimus]
MNMPLKTAGESQMRSAAATHRQETALPTPSELRQCLPVEEPLARQVDRHRQAIRNLLHGLDDRTLIVVGPCSIHDEVAALEYGEKLKALADLVSDRFLIVVRAYLEKPRTTVGWKGLLYDPERTGTGDLNEGLLRSRRLLLNLAEMGLPLATEALSPFTMDYLGDLVSWTAIGARTTESQIHREMVS